MTTKRRHERRLPGPAAAERIRWPALLRTVVLGGAAALVVVTLLVPSESAIAEGTSAPAAAGWCLLLLVWAASLWVDERPTIELGWTEASGAALVGWHSLAALVSLGHTNGRHALNAHWLIVSYAIAAFLLRQTVRTAREAKSLVAVMLFLATLVASLGLYQYGIGMPQLRREYERDPDAVLRANGIAAEEDAPQRELFENRLRSVEPLATFALTNSLAGFLSPWLIACLALALGILFDPGQRRTLIGLLLIAALLASCLVLTKSRTAYLAVAGGLVLIGLYARRGGWQLDWRLPAGVAAVLVVLGLVAVYFRGLDAKVLSEAPKSVLYRLEYWQATARMIAEAPIFGCGPGNFQQAYAAYKLPQASETVADPHNFLLEIWATVGTPGLLLLLALLGAFCYELALGTGQNRAAAGEQAEIAPPAWILFGGAMCGLVLGALVAGVVGYPLEPISPSLRWMPVVWLLAAFLVPLVWWSLAAWIQRGELTLPALLIPQIVLLVNLLAAGAIAFPGVIITLVVLAPLALFAAASVSQVAIDAASGSAVQQRTLLPRPLLPRLLRPTKAVVGLIALAALALAVTCFYTEYYPVMDGRFALDEARYRLEQRQIREVEPSAIAAARADRLSPEPWRLLADVRLARFVATGDATDWQRFIEAADTFQKLDPNSHLAWYTRGNWFLEAWRKSGRQEELTQAISAYQEAAARFPNRALYHAQVAWTLHLAGEEHAARQAAERAAELNRLMPHKEQKLTRQHVFDPRLEGEQVAKFRAETAEQTIERLRNATAENQP